MPRERAYPLTDGGGLYLDVLPSGSKVWRYMYRRDGKRVTIGPYPAIDIEKSRNEHKLRREQLHEREALRQLCCASRVWQGT